MNLSPGQRFALGLVALFGLVGPNGVFLYYAFCRWPELVAALRHPVAMALLVEAFVVLALLAVYFAKRPLGRWSWKTFVVLSLVGGLGFGIPAFVLLNSAKAGD